MLLLTPVRPTAALGAFTAAILSTFLLRDKSTGIEGSHPANRQVNLIAAMTLATIFSIVMIYIGYQVGTLVAVCGAAAALGFAGLANGPSMLNTVAVANSLRAGAAKRIAG